ncbi:MAG TPA: DivIVA domain-containing protein [Erysipelotrichaceae bacterium]|jgi:cell division initiation protein|nr:cell division protein DivIVA [Erysipelotrichia bacterium]HPX32703.1 DivIVA domain-containing protein [Erysipelotrichaceae bacterium]HQA85267.1 DivIVA domain-containing protein [Erysipelotrichaceae bacterium]
MNELRRFNLVANGYDCYQVNSEIDRLEYQIHELNERILIYQNQIETVNNQFAMIKKRYQLLVSELSMREKQADDVARLALKEANSMIDEARQNADNIIEEAVLEVQQYVDTIKEYNKISSEAKNQLTDAIELLKEKLKLYDEIQLPDPFVQSEELE